MYFKVLRTVPRKIYFSLLVLLLIVAALSIAITAEGLRIRYIEYDKNSLITVSQQGIKIRFNQSIERPNESQIRITPTLDVSLIYEGNAITLKPKIAPRYATTYTVDFIDIKPASGKMASLRAQFVSPSAQLFYVRRGGSFYRSLLSDSRPDRIMVSQLKDEDKIVYEATRIISMMVAGRSLIVNQKEANGQYRLVNYNLDTKQAEDIVSPQANGMSQLQVSRDGRKIGYVVTETKTDIKNDRLVVYDLTTRKPTTIKYPDGKDFDVANWRFIPDGSAIIAQTTQSNKIAISIRGTLKSMPLSSFVQIGDMTQQGEVILMNKAMNKISLLDLKTNKETLAIDQGTLPWQENGNGIKIMPNSSSLVQKRQIGSEASTEYGLFMTQNGAWRAIYTQNATANDILQYAVSPDEAYFAIEMSEAPAPYSDMYPEAPSSLSVKTRIVNKNTSEEMHLIDGSGVIWR